jgi:hypothetical protein
LRLLIFEDGEISGKKSCHEMTLVVFYGYGNLHEVHISNDLEQLIAAIGVSFPSGASFRDGGDIRRRGGSLTFCIIVVRSQASRCVCVGTGRR